MVTKKQEYLLSFFGLAAVIIAFVALYYQNNEVALIAASFAIITMIMSVFFIYAEDQKLEGEIDELKKENKGRKSR